MIESEPVRFAGANIKRTLTARQVREDVAVLRRHCSVFVAQEFITRGHWRSLVRAARRGWRSFPPAVLGVVRPVFGGQPVAWRRQRWEKVATRRRKLHDGVAKLTELRQLRAALLADRKSGLSCWFAGTHAVVNGDKADDHELSRGILEHDVQQVARFLRDLKSTGHPIVFQADMNIALGTPAHEEFMRVLTALGARIIGVHGVEYLIVIDGRDVDVAVQRSWTIRATRLHTDHEIRGVTFKLIHR